MSNIYKPSDPTEDDYMLKYVMYVTMVAIPLYQLLISIPLLVSSVFIFYKRYKLYDRLEFYEKAKSGSMILISSAFALRRAVEFLKYSGQPNRNVYDNMEPWISLVAFLTFSFFEVIFLIKVNSLYKFTSRYLQAFRIPEGEG